METAVEAVALTDFLLARIAHDRRVYSGHQHGLRPELASRLLAECEAKRRIVEQYEAAVVAAGEEADTEGGWIKDGVEAALATTLRLLALPYADHPDYREEWRV